MTPSLDTLIEAYAMTSRATRRTPLIETDFIARLSGAARVFVKAESLQLAGSFKIRGAYWRLTRLNDEEKARGGVAYSSGNFAQGLACAGAMLGIPVTIVMPIDAPKAKAEATRGFGATVILTDHGGRAREEVASERATAISQEHGLVLLHPFDDPHVVAGQAGAGLEAIEQLEAAGGRADLLLCPVGGGGLIGGVASAFHHKSPQTQVIAVEPEGFNGMGSSLVAGERVTVPLGGKSICDGLMARRPGAAPFEALDGLGLNGVTVTDDQVRAAMLLAFEKLKLVFEPSGAATLAALMSGSVDIAGKTVVLIASGGNASFADFQRHVGNA